MEQFKDFRPDEILTGRLSSLDQTDGTVLIVLNVAVEDRELFTKLWLRAQLRVCADGGANRLYDLFSACPEFRDAFLPSAIAGDLDSIRPDVRKYYEARSIPVHEDGDQYATDLKKCFDWIRTKGVSQIQTSTTSVSKLLILVSGSLAGRVDQAFSLLHHLCLAPTQLSPYLNDGRIYLIGADSVTFLLSPNYKNRIHLSCEEQDRTCGILPVGCPAVVSTTGLRWDVEDWPTSFSSQMSTSNAIANEVVEITCTEQVFFTVQISRGTGV